MHKRTILGAGQPATPTSLKGRQAERRRRERELERSEAHDREKRELRAIVARQEAEHREREHELSCQLLCARVAGERGLSTVESRKLENMVENERRSFRRTADCPQFDPHAALDRALGHLKGGNYVRRNQAELTAEERRQQSIKADERLRALGLQNPAAPSIVGDGRSGFGH